MGMLGNSDFWSYSRRHGFCTGPETIADTRPNATVSGHWIPELAKHSAFVHRFPDQLAKLNRYWLAFQAGVPPESRAAHNLIDTPAHLVEFL